MTNSCRKGKRSELRVSEWLRSMGFSSARRGQQHAGTAGSPDVVCDDLSSLWIEVKSRGSHPSMALVYEWLKEAEQSAGYNRTAVLVVLIDRVKPMLCHRIDGEPVIHVNEATCALALIRLNGMALRAPRSTHVSAAGGGLIYG